MYSHGGYLYMLGGWTQDGCRADHYRWVVDCRMISELLFFRISASGSSWEGRAAFHVLIHRHTAVVDEQKVRRKY